MKRETVKTYILRGHIVEESSDGTVYKDGWRVDPKNLKPRAGFAWFDGVRVPIAQVKYQVVRGHVVEEAPDGRLVYKSDGVPVDPTNLRTCAGCGLYVERGECDPCIGKLRKTSEACCGHGLDAHPFNGGPTGYVKLNDGRVFRFSGTCGSKRIRQAVDAALEVEPLPEGFNYTVGPNWATFAAKRIRSVCCAFTAKVSRAWNALS